MSLKQICLLWEGVQGDETKPGELPVLTSPLAHQIFGVPCLRAMGRGLNPGAESPGKVLYFLHCLSVRNFSFGFVSITDNLTAFFAGGFLFFSGKIYTRRLQHEVTEKLNRTCKNGYSKKV